MTNTQNSCQMCGKCCHFEIPLTLMDIHRIARLTGVDTKTAFDQYIQAKISARSGLFMIKKTSNGACIFLQSDNLCAIHEAKPRSCRFYNCSSQSQSEAIPWTVTCTSDSARAELWEQSISASISKAYIKDHGPKWNDAAYHKAILSIYENIVVRDSQTIKLARDINKTPVGMIYDCSSCSQRGVCAVETPVTLDDIRRISQCIGIGWKAFFNRNIDTKPSVNTGGLKLVRNGHCVFFDPEKHCAIEHIRPMHCRFTPCPSKVNSEEHYSCLFLGSGTVEQQFRHQVALTMTRQYVAEHGATFNKKGVRKTLEVIDRLVGDHRALEEFCFNIAPYRYVDDTIQLKHCDIKPTTDAVIKEEKVKCYQ